MDIPIENANFVKLRMKYENTWLYDFETLDGIWEHVEAKLNDANIKLKIQYRVIILGVTKSNNKGLDTNNRHTVNKVINIVKWMIWK